MLNNLPPPFKNSLSRGGIKLSISCVFPLTNSHSTEYFLIQSGEGLLSNASYLKNRKKLDNDIILILPLPCYMISITFGFLTCLENFTKGFVKEIFYTYMTPLIFGEILRQGGGHMS